MSFSENIKRIRLQRGMNKTEFAKLVGVSDAMIHHWEKGTNEPRMGRIVKLEKILGVTREELIGYGDPVYVEDEIDLDYFGTVSAGQFEDVSLDDGTLKVPRSIFKTVNPKNCFGLKVNGDSMNKILSNGSYIVVHDYRTESAPQLQQSDILLIRNGGSHTIKRVRLSDTKIHFEPDSYINEFKTDTYDIDLSEDIEVIGRVIYNYREF